MLALGFEPALGIATRKAPGAGFVLHLPFKRQDDDIADTMAVPGGCDGGISASSDPIVVAGSDLGLKYLDWLFIDRCKPSRFVDGSLERVDPARGDLARYCIDERQLAGPANAWIDSQAPPKWFRFKKRLNHAGDVGIA